MGFSIGKISFVLAVIGFLLMYANFGARCIAAWYYKKELPKDRVHFGAIVMSIVFFILGGVMQAEIDKVRTCTEAGYTFGQCFFMPKQ